MNSQRATAPPPALDAASRWWQRGVVYQIYPRSFMDSDSDGVGDLPGVTSRLDHLVHLGVDALWLSPIYASPMADFGYDVADYTSIEPVFGSLAAFDALVAAAHARGLRVILDFVPNHSSDRHAWFAESRASRDSPKRDWYLWRDPAPDGGPPTNWLSEFGGPAWTLDRATGQYYYHAYLSAQPDLNWRNPAVRAAMLDVLRFWLDRGVDGFRVDAIHQLIKDDQFRHNPPNPEWQKGMPPHKRVLRHYTADLAEVHDAVAAMRRVVDAYPGERVLIGEAYLPIERLMAYYGRDLGGFHLPFNFHLIASNWEPEAIARLIADYEAALPPGAWPNWVLGNHDKPRIASRLGPAQARVAAMLLLTLRGTPTIYQGEEIGMRDVPVPPDRVRDPFEKNVPGHGRDPCRTPMRWDAGPGAGFTTGEPWLPMGDDVAIVNVAAQDDDLGSMLSLYRALLALRRSEPALAIGSYRELLTTDSLIAYARDDGDRQFAVVLNLAAAPKSVEVGALGFQRACVLLSTTAGRIGDRATHAVRLDANEGLILGTAS